MNGREKVPKKRYTAIAIVLMAIAVMPFIFIISVLAWDNVKEYASRRDFDSSLWSDTTKVFSYSEPVRIQMVDDLLSEHDINGMTRSQVVHLLGEPDRTSYFRHYDMVYWLGPERGFMSIDSEWLVIRLDSSNTVSEHRIVTD